MELDDLLETLRRIEALHVRTDVPGERQAAAVALDAMGESWPAWLEQDPPVEYKFTMADNWSRRLFTALLRRYGIQPYRYHGQRRTTVMARASKSFVDQTLWPEFIELSNVLQTYLSDVTECVIRQAIFEDSSEAEERPPMAAIEVRDNPTRISVENTPSSLAIAIGSRSWSVDEGGVFPGFRPAPRQHRESVGIGPCRSGPTKCEAGHGERSVLLRWPFSVCA